MNAIVECGALALILERSSRPAAHRRVEAFVRPGARAASAAAAVVAYVPPRLAAASPPCFALIARPVRLRAEAARGDVLSARSEVRLQVLTSCDDEKLL